VIKSCHKQFVVSSRLSGNLELCGANSRDVFKDVFQTDPPFEKVPMSGTIESGSAFSQNLDRISLLSPSEIELMKF
jgi:hypothetical protein